MHKMQLKAQITINIKLNKIKNTLLIFYKKMSSSALFLIYKCL